MLRRGLQADTPSRPARRSGGPCNVTSFELADGVGTYVSPTAGILTLTGTVNGSCGDTDTSGQEIHRNSVYVKVGDAWKWAFGFNSPL